MQDPISLSIGRVFVDVPKTIEWKDYCSYLVYIQVVNGRKYKFEHEVIIGTKMRIFFDAEKRRFKYVSYEDYLKWKEEDQLDGRNTN